METVNRIVEALILQELNRGNAFDRAVSDAIFKFDGIDLDAAIGQLTQLQAKLSAAHDRATDLGLNQDDATSLKLG
jgi:hypothetical protein